MALLAAALGGCGTEAGPSAGLAPPLPGTLHVTLAGLPDGVPASVVLTGSGGFTRTIAASTTLTGLAPGSYSLAAEAVTSAGDRYEAAPASQSVSISSGATVAALPIAYAIATGRIDLAVTGLPEGAAGAVRLTGPGGFAVTATASGVHAGLAPGTYGVRADSVLHDSERWRAAPDSQAALVTPGTAPTPVSVAYGLTTGRLDLTVAGLPAGSAGSVTVTGPAGFAAALGASTLLKGLAPGGYTVAAANVTVDGVTYVPSAASQPVTVAAGPAPAAATVTYARGTGSIAVTVQGLPAGSAAAVTVTGPAGFSAAVTATAVLSGLEPGAYTVAAAGVSAGGQSWTPTPASQPVTVAVGASAAATVTYASASPPPPSTLNLTIDGMYLTQAAQRYDGSVPLVAGRNAVLRVFARANLANTAMPSVRVRLYSGPSLIQTSTIPAPGVGVPTAVNEGSMAASWNLLVPAALVQPNLRVLADVDPGNTVAEGSETDNEFPAGGTPFAVDVRALTPLQLRFVPVLQQVNGLQGDVTAGNAAQFLADALKLLPIAAHDTDVRAVYTTTAPELQSGNGNAAWGTVLSEVHALKTADASSRYYYGVVKTTYSSGVAGIGYVGGNARTALGWDRLPSGSGVMAHELGHNMSRPHAPCGGVGSPDPSYPHPGGQIGIWGLDVATLALKAPTTTFDLMGYCNPDWVSDYSWSAMVQYRQSNPAYAPAAAAAGPHSGLLVWGRRTAAGVVLEPAFPVPGPPSGVDPASRYRIEALALDGRVLFAAGLATLQAVDDVNAPEEHFAAVLPLDPAALAALAGLRLVTPGGTVVRMSAQAVAQRGRAVLLRDPGAAVRRPNPVQADLRWDAATYPMALVRDAATGQILSFARGGRALLWTRAADLDVTFSDGARGLNARLRP